MDVHPALVLVGVLALLALALGGTLAFLASRPTPENRPAPPSVLAAREQARRDALARRQQQQREASARISRGW